MGVLAKFGRRIDETIHVFRHGSLGPEDRDADPGPVIGGATSKMISSENDKFFEFPFNPDVLYRKRGDYSIYDKMLEDDQISAVLRLKAIMVTASGWKIEPGEGEDEQGDFFDWVLNDYPGRSFDNVLRGIQTAYGYGFSLTEKCGAVIDVGKWKGKIGIFAYKTRQPHGILYHVDDFGHVNKITQDEIELDPRKFIHYINLDAWGNPFGDSDINEGVYRSWWSKLHTYKFWNMYQERFGSPFIDAAYDGTVSKTEREDMLSVLKNLQARTGLVRPKGFDVQLHEAAKQGGAGFKELIDHHDTRIARAILVPDLIGMSGGETSGGSFALGKEQFDLFYTVLQSDRNELQRTVNREIIKPLLSWNFIGAQDMKTKFVLNPLTEEDKFKIAELWNSAVEKGSVIPTTNQTDHFIELLGFPETDQAELKKIQDDKNAMAEKIAAGKMGGGQDDEDEEKEEEEEKKNLVLQGKTLKFARETSRRRADGRKARKDLEERKQKLVEDQAGIVKKAIASYTDQIQKKKILQKGDPALIGDLKLKFRAEFRSTTRAGLDDVFKFGKKTGQIALGITKFAIVDDIGGLTPEAARAWLDQIAERVSSAEWAEIQKKTTPILENAIQAGKGIPETMKELDIVLQPWDLEFGAARLETIARTNFNSVFNEGRNQVFKEASDQIAAFEFSAIIDGRTSDICRELDGHQFRKQDADKFQPPMEFNCRSILLPILTGEDFELKKLPETEGQPGGFRKLIKKSPEKPGPSILDQ